MVCIGPLGSPVVPEVKAIRQMSSDAVSQAAKLVVARLRHQRFERIGATTAPVDDPCEFRRELPRLVHLARTDAHRKGERNLRLAIG